MKRGLFVVFEGPDGAGTTTQARILKQHIQTDLGFGDVSLSREPGESEYGLLIKKVLIKETRTAPFQLAQWYVWDSLEHNKLELKPVRQRKGIAISDRYRSSSFAYQTTDGVSLDQVSELHEKEGDNLEIPDFTYFLDMDAEISMQRVNGRHVSEGTSPELFDRLEFQRKVHSNYLSLINSGLKYLGKVIRVDGTLPKEKVSQEVNRTFDEFYRQWASSD